MRPLDIIRQKRRFEMFSEKTKDKVLELNAFFGKYNMHFEEKIKKTFIYYDTPNQDLMKSNIVLFKTVIGKTAELNMANERVSETGIRYNQRKMEKHCALKIRPHDSILKHKEFLIDSFKNMFMSSVNFDPEFLMRKLQVAYTLETTSLEYRSMNISGLKITYSFDQDKYTNHYNNQKIKANILTIYQHSSINTDADFDNLMGKLTRYLKELTPTDETKIKIARRLTVVKDQQIDLEKNKKLRDEMRQKLKKKKSRDEEEE